MVTPDGRREAARLRAREGRARRAEIPSAGRWRRSPRRDAVRIDGGRVMGTPAYMSPSRRSARRWTCGRTSSRSAWSSTRCSRHTPLRRAHDGRAARRHRARPCAAAPRAGARGRRGPRSDCRRGAWRRRRPTGSPNAGEIVAAFAGMGALVTEPRGPRGASFATGPSRRVREGGLGHAALRMGAPIAMGLLVLAGWWWAKRTGSPATDGTAVAVSRRPLHRRPRRAPPRPRRPTPSAASPRSRPRTTSTTPPSPRTGRSSCSRTTKGSGSSPSLVGRVERWACRGPARDCVGAGRVDARGRRPRAPVGERRRAPARVAGPARRQPGAPRARRHRDGHVGVSGRDAPGRRLSRGRQARGRPDGRRPGGHGRHLVGLRGRVLPRRYPRRLRHEPPGHAPGRGHRRQHGRAHGRRPLHPHLLRRRPRVAGPRAPPLLEPRDRRGILPGERGRDRRRRAPALAAARAMAHAGPGAAGSHRRRRSHERAGDAEARRGARRRARPGGPPSRGPAPPRHARRGRRAPPRLAPRRTALVLLGPRQRARPLCPGRRREGADAARRPPGRCEPLAREPESTRCGRGSSSICGPTLSPTQARRGSCSGPPAARSARSGGSRRATRRRSSTAAPASLRAACSACSGTTR